MAEAIAVVPVDPVGVCSEALVSHADARRLPCHASDHANLAGETIAFGSSGVNAALSRGDRT